MASTDQSGIILFICGKVQFHLLTIASLELIHKPRVHKLAIAGPIDFEGYPVGTSLNAVGSKATQGFYSPNSVLPLKIEHADVVQASIYTLFLILPKSQDCLPFYFSSLFF
jgi:hypothetical protein